MSNQERNPKYVHQSTLTQEIARDPLSADLLFSFFASAAGTIYQDPNLPVPKDRTLEDIIQNMPPMQQLGSYSSDLELQQAIGQESYEILRSVILESPIAYSLLPSSLEVPEFRRQDTSEVKTCYQFIAIQSPPEKEEIFQQIKSKANGSFFAWHGSVPQCWNKISREELKDMSGTKFMRNGCAYGRGICLALDSSVGINYAMESPNKYKNSQLGQNISVLALCEVADLPNRKEFKVEVKTAAGGENKTYELSGELRNNDWSYNLTLNEACIIRYLFVNFDAKINFHSDPIPKFPTLEDALNSKD